MALHLPRSVPDDADLTQVPLRERHYGGHPSPLAAEEAQNRAKELLGDGKSCDFVARALGYQSVAAFSEAFNKLFGMRPSAYAKSVDAPKVVKKKPREGIRQLRKRKPRLTGAKPLPRFDAKKKAPKKTSKKSRPKK